VHLVARKKKDFVVETLLNALDVKLQYLRENMVATLLLQSSSCYGGEEVRSKESGALYVINYIHDNVSTLSGAGSLLGS
jgi:hypothetical protein